MAQRVPGAEEPEKETALTEVNTWFANRGFHVVPSAVDHSEAVRSSPWGRRSLARNHHAWVDLAKPDGTVLVAGYGSGPTFADAAERARRRWQEEQGSGTPPSPRTLQ
jgi:hypothetical protein